MEKILHLGDHYISNFVPADYNYADEKKYNLDLYLDETIGAPRLLEGAPASKMYGQYWYRSGINNSMVAELKNIATEISSRVKYTHGDVWLDIACNDGTMFDFIPSEFSKIGIDPCDDSYLADSRGRADCVVQDFFTEKAYRDSKLGHFDCKVITSIAMFYDLEDPHTFIADIKKVLDRNGVWVLQLSYTPLMVEQLAFDNICHEHIYYHSLTSIRDLVEQHQMEVVDATLNDTNGGSVRIYVRNKTANKDLFGTQPIRDVCDFRVKALLAYERTNYDVMNLAFWDTYQDRIDALKTQTVNFIKNVVSEGKTVMGYGASTKGNTLLQYFGLDHTHITAMVERSPYKFGLHTIGTNIPIISEIDMRKAKPDYLLVLPWHFISSFVERESEFLDGGGRFIVPCPKFKIIGND